ncbi:hypothetical protein [Plantactinospora sp. BB1]|nr:hypothetical protein [Plantactinospora sp. BB1]
MSTKFRGRGAVEPAVRPADSSVLRSAGAARRGTAASEVSR